MKPEEVSLNSKEKLVVFIRFIKKLLQQTETKVFLLFLLPSLLCMIFGNFTVGGAIVTGWSHFFTALLVGLFSSIALIVIFVIGFLIYEGIRDNVRPFLAGLYYEESMGMKKEIIENVERKHLLK